MVETSATYDILIVEDSETDAKLIGHELRRMGRSARCVRVEQEHELREALARQRWSLVISDSSTPGLDATSALRITRAQQPDVPFIVVSGSISEAATAEALALGAIDVVSKDHLHRLAHAVARGLGSAASVPATTDALADLAALLDAAAHHTGEVRQRALEDARTLLARVRGIDPAPTPVSTEPPTTAPEGIASPATPRLTPRQVEVLRLIAEGLSTREIADALQVSVKTVESHRAQLLLRIGVRGVAGLVRCAIRMGLVGADP
ncbi:MAG: response regulator transcription factor [Deltaproteobacteria bacterium]|nr:response regulator transcription factor [Deltaproteobacteria bacterium]MBK8718977.1 response regulator transcription factor [Deltaproteobacteria bacterium]MBP7285410.1 response regulator transcription factor [Nannocystaceae bacterium]